jgi:hypothetical protein
MLFLKPKDFPIAMPVYISDKPDYSFIEITDNSNTFLSSVK